MEYHIRLTEYINKLKTHAISYAHKHPCTQALEISMFISDSKRLK